MNTNEKWPEVLGLNLQTLQLRDFPGLEITETGSATSGETYSLFTGPINHPSFDTVSLKIWDIANGLPSHIRLSSDFSDDLENVGPHLIHKFGEPEIVEEEYLIWNKKNMYMVLTLQGEMRLDIYLNRHAELESETFQELFDKYCTYIPEEI